MTNPIRAEFCGDVIINIGDRSPETINTIGSPMSPSQTFFIKVSEFNNTGRYCTYDAAVAEARRLYPDLYATMMATDPARRTQLTNAGDRKPEDRILYADKSESQALNDWHNAQQTKEWLSWLIGNQSRFPTQYSRVFNEAASRYGEENWRNTYDENFNRMKTKLSTLWGMMTAKKAQGWRGSNYPNTPTK